MIKNQEETIDIRPVFTDNLGVKVSYIFSLGIVVGVVIGSLGLGAVQEKLNVNNLYMTEVDDQKLLGKVQSFPEWQKLAKLSREFVAYPQSDTEVGFSSRTPMTEMATERRTLCNTIRQKLWKIDPRFDLEEYSWRMEPSNSRMSSDPAWAPMPKLVYAGTRQL